jgi:hypothetical protein
MYLLFIILTMQLHQGGSLSSSNSVSINSNKIGYFDSLKECEDVASKIKSIQYVGNWGQPQYKEKIPQIDTFCIKVSKKKCND